MEDNFDLYKSTMRKIMHISRLHRCVFEKNISKMGIHHSQHHLLMYIAMKGEITSQKEIADKFNVSSAAVARSLKELEAEGYVTKEATKEDSRFNRITITQKGKDMADETHKMFKETDISIFEDLDQEDVELLNSLLDKIQEKLIEKNKGSCCERKS